MCESAPDRRVLVKLTLIWVALVFSVLSWRSGTYYAGGVDPVVAAKAAISIFALGLAVSGVWRTPRTKSLGVQPLVLAIGYLTITMLGAMAAGTFAASSVLTVRVIVVLATVTCLVLTHEFSVLIRTLSAAMAGIAGVIAVTGLPSYLQEGRLGGGLLPVNPNEIALLVSLPALVVTWRLVTSPVRRADVAALLTYLAVTWMTGSRTGLAALLVAMALLILHARRVPPAVYVVVLSILPLGFFLIASTNVVMNFVGRGNVETIWTLSNRTVAWSAAFSAPTGFWEHWFGGGLAVKTVAVSGMFWDAQVIDNSWVAAYVKGGVIGMGVMAVWALATVLNVLRLRRPVRAFLVPLLVYLLISSVTGSGLLDADVRFVMMVLIALVTDSVYLAGIDRASCRHSQGAFTSAGPDVSVPTTFTRGAEGA